MPLTPGAGNSLGSHLALEPPLSLEDDQTPHSFLSDSSLDGAPEALREEGDDEEDKEAGDDEVHVETTNVSLSGVNLEGNSNKSPQKENEEENDRNSCTDEAVSAHWGGHTEDQNGDLDKCELSLDNEDLPRIKS